MKSSVTSRSAPPLSVRGLTKSFGSTRAVRDVSFDVRSGEVHALLGHNGSGKSTLVKMISGLVRPDSGVFTVGSGDDGVLRIGVVHQDLALCADATVLENCCMGDAVARRGPFIDWDQERRTLLPILDSLAAHFGPSTMVRDLSPANQAVVAIARALKRGATGAPLDLLVLDEATARLRGTDADMVLATARRVAAQGGGVLLVTHHMSEVLSAADRATVLASGAVVDTVDVSSTDEEQLLRMVSGRDVTALRRTPPPPKAADQAPLLVLDRVTGEQVHDLSFEIRAGEILGVTGATGAGFEELPYLITRPDRCHDGTIHLGGVRLRGRTYSETRSRGVGVVPADRLINGVYVAASVRENLSPVVRRHNRVLGLVASPKERSWARRTASAFQVRTAGPDAPIGSLSGGNQQKVLLARVLEDQPKVLILHEPTQGVDEPTRRALIEIVRGAARAGTAVLYVSCDVDEVAGAADRVLVLRDGRCVHESPGGLDRADAIYAASYLTGAATP